MRRVLVGGLLLLGWVLGSSAEAANVNATLRFDPDLPAGADSEGRVLLYTPKPLDVGSSHSHFESSARPNLLMEPFTAPDLRIGRVDITKQAMQDLGWPQGTARIRLFYEDDSQDGFNDPGLGSQRRAALERAVGVWSRIVASSVTVNVSARFEELSCDEEGGVLARAGPRFVFLNFPGGVPGVWYSGPLAESLSGQNLSSSDEPDPNAADIRIVFNSAIDTECLGAGSGFHYGLNGKIPSRTISFVNVALHELGHGLGFVGLVDLVSGELFRGSPDVFTARTFDTRKQKYWGEMTNAQRRKSAKRRRKVSFDGDNTTRRAANYLTGSAVVEVNEPRNLVGSYFVGTATFGPPLDERGVLGDLALADDGSSKPTFACQPLTNGAEISGKIAVIDRGDCFFVEKVKNAQNAGAIGAIIVHNERGFPPDLGGTDDTIVIPAVRIGKKDGRRIKRTLRR